MAVLLYHLGHLRTDHHAALAKTQAKDVQRKQLLLVVIVIVVINDDGLVTDGPTLLQDARNVLLTRRAGR